MASIFIEEIMAVLNKHPELNPEIIKSFNQALARFQNLPQAGYHALQEVLKLKRVKNNPESIRAFIGIVSFYPLGTLVLLNTDEIGAIITTCNQHPLRGKVKLLTDCDGMSRADYKTIDLCERPFYYIVKPLEDEEILERNLEWLAQPITPPS